MSILNIELSKKLTALVLVFDVFTASVHGALSSIFDVDVEGSVLSQVCTFNTLSCNVAYTIMCNVQFTCC